MKLFTPVRAGTFDLFHRVLLAPLTRMWSDMPGNLPGAAMREYSRQRVTPGGLLIAEATFISRGSFFQPTAFRTNLIGIQQRFPPFYGVIVR